MKLSTVREGSKLPTLRVQWHLLPARSAKMWNANILLQKGSQAGNCSGSTTRTLMESNLVLNPRSKPSHVQRKFQDPKLSWGSAKTTSRFSKTGGYHINGPVILQTRQKLEISSAQHVPRTSTEPSLIALGPSWKLSLNSSYLTRWRSLQYCPRII